MNVKFFKRQKIKDQEYSYAKNITNVDKDIDKINPIQHNIKEDKNHTAIDKDISTQIHIGNL